MPMAYGVEDVPCKRADDAERVMGPPRNPDSGDEFHIYFSGHSRKMWKNDAFHTDRYNTFDVQIFLMHPKSFKSYSRRAV